MNSSRKKPGKGTKNEIRSYGQRRPRADHTSVCSASRGGVRLVVERGEAATVVRMQRGEALRDTNGFSSRRRVHAEDANRRRGRFHPDRQVRGNRGAGENRLSS